MTVSELIKQLQKMPKGVHVGISHGDNYTWEIAGWVSRVECHNKIDYVDDVAQCNDRDSLEMFKDNPQVWVTLHC